MIGSVTSLPSLTDQQTNQQKETTVQREVTLPMRAEQSEGGGAGFLLNNYFCYIIIEFVFPFALF